MPFSTTRTARSPRPTTSTLGIPETSIAGDGSLKTAYQFKPPAELNACDDLYVMPHADPEWATHSNLVPWDDQGGSIWAACHAVSVLESVTDPGDPDPDPEMNFLSTEGLIDFGDHDDATPPYDYTTLLGGDPIMQFLGDIDDAVQNGSEQIFLPAAGSAWRPTTSMLVWDPDQSDLISQGGISPGEAGVRLYGRGFGDPTNGYVMYEAGHSHDKDSDDDVAAQRAFLNLNLLTGIERGIDVKVGSVVRHAGDGSPLPRAQRDPVALRHRCRLAPQPAGFRRGGYGSRGSKVPVRGAECGGHRGRGRHPSALAGAPGSVAQHPPSPPDAGCGTSLPGARYDFD